MNLKIYSPILSLFSFIKGMLEKMRFSFKKPPLKEKIANAVYRLEGQNNKLEQTSARLHQRDRDMFERCVGARAANDNSRAAIYANECVEIRKMAKIVLTSQLAIERVILRLQTIEDFGDLLIQVAPIVGIVKETKSKLVGVIPEVANELEEINGLLNNTLIETGNVQMENTSIEAATSEARKVLEEASALAEQKISEVYPELPIPEAPPKRVFEAPLSASGPHIQPFQAKPEFQVGQFDNSIYEYIKKCSGDLQLSKCASEFNVSVDDVKKAIERLENEGKIVIQ